MVANTSPQPLLTPAWQMLRDQVLHTAETGDSVQVICGAPGAGKTTFLMLLGAAASTDWLAVTARPDGEEGSVLRRILERVGDPPPAGARPGEVIVALRSAVQSLEKAERRTVVAIDDAHLLGAGELAGIISILQGRGEGGYGLHLIFLAQPGLAEQIDELQLLDVEVHDVYLPALAAGELHQVLAREASARGVSFDDSGMAAEARWANSSGLPGPALAELDDAPPAERPVAEPTVEEDTAPPPRRRALPPLGHVAALVVLVGILIWAVLVRHEPTAPEAPVPATDPAPAVDPSAGVRTVPVAEPGDPEVLSIPADSSPPAGGARHAVR